MRKLSLVAGALVLIAGASCTDHKVLTEAGPVKLSPGAATRDVLTVSGGVFTSTNPSDDTDPAVNHNLCQNSKDSNAPAIDCNIYFSKSFVWLSGGPGPSALPDGTYFFAVVVPGGQNTSPNDGGDLNLSDATADLPAGTLGSGDSYLNRVFTVSGGVISYAGTHDFDPTRHMIRLMPYDNTTNSGGEYSMAVCNLGATLLDEGGNFAGYEGYPADASKCKYDNFKVDATKPCPNQDAGDCQFHTSATLSIVKTLDTRWDRSFSWTVAKSVDKTVIEQVGGNATFNYTVNVRHDVKAEAAGYSGTVTVTNTSSVAAQNVTISDPNAPSLSCTPALPVASLSAGGTIVCNYTETSALPPTSVTNTATASWSTVDPNGDPSTPSISDQVTKGFTLNQIDECVNVSDVFNALPADQKHTYCVGDLGEVNNAFSFTYSRVVPVPPSACKAYDNTATYKTTDTYATNSSTVHVSVCGAVAGGLTMGFWHNKNGQGIITGGAYTGLGKVCNSGTWLRGYAPFQDLSATATCADVAAYFLNVFKAANASGAAMNAMLKGQMLATGLDVYFSDPALGGNKIAAPVPLGGVNVDLTKICKMIDDGLGGATCPGTFTNASSAFGGATSKTVSQILTYAASQSNVGGSVWYAQVKVTQELAKNTFDAINNGVALVAP
jgi:hypothetical protein